MNNVYQLLYEVIAAQENITAESDVLFLNSAGDMADKSENTTYYQPFKPLSQSDVLPNILPEYDHVIICGTKHVKETQYYLSVGLQDLKNKGHIVIAADNKENGKRLEKWLQDIGINSIKFSAHKAQCLVGQKPQDLNTELLQEWSDAGRIQKNSAGFYAQPGLFSWEKSDAASKLLIEAIPLSLKGNVADFGCGYGFISASVVQKHDKIKSIHGYDADARALDCFQRNLKEAAFEDVETFWCDLGQPYKTKQLYDVILMNPPFHEGRKDKPDLGIAFIKNASKSLRKKGVLWMVANKHLPYEQTLNSEFFKIEKIVEKDGFKIFRAEK